MPHHAADHMTETVEHATEHSHNTRFRARGGLVLTVLPVLLAIVAVFVQRGLKNEVVASVDLSGTRSSQETAQLLQAEARWNAPEVTMEAQLPALSDEACAALQQEAGTERRRKRFKKRMIRPAAVVYASWCARGSKRDTTGMKEPTAKSPCTWRCKHCGAPVIAAQRRYCPACAVRRWRDRVKQDQQTARQRIDALYEQRAADHGHSGTERTAGA
jgi:hypothetical protein